MSALKLKPNQKKAVMTFQKMNRHVYKALRAITVDQHPIVLDFRSNEAIEISCLLIAVTKAMDKMNMPFRPDQVPVLVKSEKGCYHPPVNIHGIPTAGDALLKIRVNTPVQGLNDWLFQLQTEYECFAALFGKEKAA